MYFPGVLRFFHTARICWFSWLQAFCIRGFPASGSAGLPGAGGSEAHVAAPQLQRDRGYLLLHLMLSPCGGSSFSAYQDSVKGKWKCLHAELPLLLPTPARINVMQGLGEGILSFPVYFALICDSRHLAAFLLLVFFSALGNF